MVQLQNIKSKAVLIGTSTYNDDQLPDIPQVHRNLSRLRRCLIDPRIGGWGNSDIKVVHNPADESIIGKELEQAASSATGMLLVYIAGHGLIDRRRELHLAVKKTSSSRPEYLSLPSATIRAVMAESVARTKVLIADCCYSGRLISGHLGASQDILVNQLEAHGSVTLASCAGDLVSLAPAHSQFTAFTGELIDILETGDVAESSELTLQAVYLVIRGRLRARGFPEPRMLASESSAMAPIVHNVAYGKVAPSRPYLTFPAGLPDAASVKYSSSSDPAVRAFLETFGTATSDLPLPNTSPVSMRQITGVEQALAIAIESEKRGQQLPIGAGTLAIDAVGSVLQESPNAVGLRYMLAQFLGGYRDYRGAVDQISLMFEATGSIGTKHLSFAAEMLMNLSELQDAQKLWAASIKRLSEESTDGRLIVPISSEEARLELVKARIFETLWITDYQGNKNQVIAQSRRLMEDETDLPPELSSNILHRVGRAQTDIAFTNHDKDLLRASLRTLKRARKLAGDSVNPHAYMAEYYTRRALDLPGGDAAWSTATEQFEGWPDSSLAHYWLALGRRLRRETPFSAVEPLTSALDIWAAHPYPSGACDALIELGLVYNSFPSYDDQIRGLAYFAAGTNIASRLGLSQQLQSQMYTNRSATRLGVEDARVAFLVNDSASRWPRLFTPHGLDAHTRSGLLSLVQRPQSNARNLGS